MSREEAKKKLIELGIAEPSEEQVTGYLNTIQAEVGAVKKQSDDGKEAKKRADALESEKKTLEERLAAIERENREIKIIGSLTKMGADTEKAKTAAKAFIDGDFDALSAVWSEVLTNATQAAAEAKEREIAQNAPNPGGGNGGQKEPELSVAEQIAKRMYGKAEDNNSGKDILDYYTRR